MIDNRSKTFIWIHQDFSLNFGQNYGPQLWAEFTIQDGIMMERISIADDIVPVGEFKAGLAKWLRSVKQTGHPIIITQNGRPAGVLLSPQEFDRLQLTKSFLDSVKRGIADAEAGRVLKTSELKQELEKRRESRSTR